jgi:hypothetical protein
MQMLLLDGDRQHLHDVTSESNRDLHRLDDMAFEIGRDGNICMILLSTQIGDQHQPNAIAQQDNLIHYNWFISTDPRFSLGPEWHKDCLGV